MSDNQPTVRDAKPFFALILGLILFLFGIAIGYTLSGKTAAQPGGKGYQEGYAAAKAEYQAILQGTGFALPEEQLQALESQPVLNVSGTVTGISGNTITLATSLPSFDVLNPPESKTLAVRITDDTTIEVRREMTPEESDAAFVAFQEAQEAFDQQIAGLLDDPAFDGVLPEGPQPPEPFSTEEVGLDALMVGMTVTVTSQQDIRSNASVDAVSISFSEALATEEAPVGPEIAEPLPGEEPLPEEEPLP